MFKPIKSPFLNNPLQFDTSDAGKGFTKLNVIDSIKNPASVEQQLELFPTTLSPSVSNAVGNPIIVSLSVLLQYGTDCKERILQKLMSHRLFNLYQQEQLTRAQFVAETSRTFKLSSEEVQSLLDSLLSKCTVNLQLLESLENLNFQVIGWMDLPFYEFKAIAEATRSILDKKVTKIIFDLDAAYCGSGTVVLAKSLELSAQLRSNAWLAYPYTSTTLSEIHTFPARSLDNVLLNGKKALHEIISNKAYKSTVVMDQPVNKKDINLNNSDESDNLKKICYVGDLFEYFNPTLAATVASKDLLSQSIVDQVKQLIQDGPFGYFGTNYNKLPADIDTMSLNIAYFYESGYIDLEQANAALDRILTNLDKDSNLLVYFDADRPRTDQVVLCNVVYCGYVLNRSDDPIIKRSVQLLSMFLLNDGYQFGTHYYRQPESFLYHFGRILSKFNLPNQRLLTTKFIRCLKLRLGLTGTVLDLAKRILLCNWFQVENLVDQQKLLELQQPDGSWPESELYLLPTTKGKVYNQLVDQAFAMKAVEVIQQVELRYNSFTFDTITKLSPDLPCLSLPMSQQSSIDSELSI